jgi:hypothetical protein
MGEAKIGMDDSAENVRSATLVGAVGRSEMNFLKLVFEHFGQRGERCDGVIPDVREWYLRMRVFLCI